VCTHPLFAALTKHSTQPQIGPDHVHAAAKSDRPIGDHWPCWSPDTVCAVWAENHALRLGPQEPRPGTPTTSSPSTWPPAH